MTARGDSAGNSGIQLFMTKKLKFRSPIAKAMHETVSGMHRLGLVDDDTMRKCNERCIIEVEPSKPVTRKSKNGKSA